MKAVAAGVGFLALGAACGSPSHKSESCVTPYDAGNFPAATVSFQTQIRPLFPKYGCDNQFCHGGLPPASGYSLALHTELFGPGLEANQRHGCDIVRGDSAGSYLVMKLKGDPSIEGVAMPEGAAAMDSADLLVFERWIAEGAADN